MSKKTGKFTVGLTPLLLALIGGGCFVDDYVPASSAGDTSDSDTSGSDDSFGSITITVPITTVTTDPTGGDTGSTGGTDTDTGSTGDTESDTEGDTETAGDLISPEIFDVSLTPDPIYFNGSIEVSVIAEGEGVRLTYGAEQVQGETTVELEEVQVGLFKGEIEVLTGLDNGDEHTATLVAWRGGEQDLEESEPVEATYEIQLKTPGGEAFWMTGDAWDVGFGEVRGVGTLPGGNGILEFGMAGKGGKTRCYIRFRGKGGASKDYLELLPGAQCEATDMKIGDDGTVHVLVRRKTDSGWYWALIKIPTWGAEPEEIGQGSKDEVAYALAEFDGTIAVCGAAPTASPFDLTDAMVKIFRPGEFGQTKMFDHKLGLQSHKLDESFKDCVFADEQTLLGVGEAFGKHEGKWDLDRSRRLHVFYDLLKETGKTQVMGGDLAIQSFATAVDVSGGRAVVAGRTCDDVCDEQNGKLWEIDAEGTVSETSIGQHKLQTFAPHDVLWSPAKYVLVASGGLLGEGTVFVVRAFELGKPEPLWTYSRKDANLLSVALTLAVGRYGEVYAGGWGADGYPAFAIIFG